MGCFVCCDSFQHSTLWRPFSSRNGKIFYDEKYRIAKVGFLLITGIVLLLDTIANSSYFKILRYAIARELVKKAI